MITNVSGIMNVPRVDTIAVSNLTPISLIDLLCYSMFYHVFLAPPSDMNCLNVNSAAATLNPPSSSVNAQILLPRMLSSLRKYDLLQTFCSQINLLSASTPTSALSLDARNQCFIDIANNLGLHLP